MLLVYSKIRQDGRGAEQEGTRHSRDPMQWTYTFTKISEQEAQINRLQTEQLTLSSANSVPLEQMRMEAEQLQMAISIIEPKVHILDSQLAEISTLEQENKKHFYSLQIRDNAMQSEHEAMTKFLSQRESIIRQQSNELFQLKSACNEHDARMEGIAGASSCMRCLTQPCSCQT